MTGLYNAGFLGEGQTVALYELDNYVPSDISAYTKCYGGSSVPISRLVVNGGMPAAPDQGAIEVELDMELVLSTAPHLAALRVYEAANNSVDALAEWSRIVSDAVPVVSTSWESCESSAFAQVLYVEENMLFKIAAVQGQSIFAAAGDLGNNEYQATSDYDMTTGLGSYNALPLATDLELLAKNQTNGRLSPASNTWYFAEGSFGGSFSEFITLLNPSPIQAATVYGRVTV